MRRHRAFQGVQMWREPERIRRLVDPAKLVAARLEPIVRHGHDEAALDLLFGDDGGYVVVPAIVVPTRHAILRESDPLVWPEAVAAALDDSRTDALAERLLPWLRDALSGRAVHAERATLFDPAREADWERARRLGFVGAAPLADAWGILAPYAYARRFARERAILIAAASAPAGYAVLVPLARRVHALEVQPVDAELAGRWFGVPCALGDDPAADVVVADPKGREALGAHAASRRVWIGEGAGVRVPLPRAVPFEVAFAYSEARAEAAASLAVEAVEAPPELALPAVPAGRRSRGRILLLARADSSRAPDADTDEVRALCDQLAAEGLEAEATSAMPRAGQYDLIHVVGLGDPARTRDALAAARVAGLPTVLTPRLEDVEREGYWGSEVNEACFSLRPDEAGISMLLELLQGRRLASATVAAAGGPPPAYGETVREALSLADAVVVVGAGEERLVRDRFGYRGVVEVAAPIFPRDRPAGVRWLVGDDPFALLLAPLEPRTNALLALRAAQDAGLRLVVAGGAAAPTYAALLHEYAGDDGIVVEDPSAEVEAGLLATCRLFLDCSWISRGPGRLLRAASHGAAVVASIRGWGAEVLAPMLEAVDPASVEAIAGGLRRAWAREPGERRLPARAAASLEPRAALDRLLSLYARVAASPNPIN